VLVIAKAEAADVQALAVVEIEPAETQVALGRVQLGAAILVQLGERFAFGPRLVVLGGRVQPDGREPPRRRGPQRVQPLVEHRQVILLVRQLSEIA
jgi:hypothetical protein